LDGRLTWGFVGSEKVQTALAATVQANRPAGDTRRRAQQLADAQVQLCDDLLTAGTLPFLRTVGPHLRRAVEARDHGCGFAGRHAPTSW
jgi:hypothetical protein